MQNQHPVTDHDLPLRSVDPARRAEFDALFAEHVGGGDRLAVLNLLLSFGVHRALAGQDLIDPAGALLWQRLQTLDLKRQSNIPISKQIALARNTVRAILDLQSADQASTPSVPRIGTVLRLSQVLHVDILLDASLDLASILPLVRQVQATPQTP